MTTNVYFVMDETLIRSSDYFNEKVRELLISRKEYHLIDELETLIESGKSTECLPQSFPQFYKEVLVLNDYMKDVKPTSLFNYFFKVPGNKPRDVEFSIIITRGKRKESYHKTKKWIEAQDPCVVIKDIHFVNDRKESSKLNYLLKLHPDGDFILVVDRPLTYIDDNHHSIRHVRISDPHNKFRKEFKHQVRVKHEPGFFNLKI